MPQRSRRLMACVVLSLGVSVVAAPGVLAAPAPAATCPNGGPPAGEAASTVPWAQQRYALDRLTGIADGSSIIVAVVDSGVDRVHPQLTDAVLPGYDALDDSANGATGGQLDCVGHGTGVAGVIAARPTAGVPFRGVAPRARILPIRVSEQQELDGRTVGRAGTYHGLAIGIQQAVKRGAKVINLSLTAQTDDPEVRAAIAQAASNGVVLVAAAGNHHGDGVDPPSYPAAYPHVIGVGAIGSDGSRAQTSQVGDYVDLMAPGAGILTAAPVRGYHQFDGTSFAAPFVAATAALILQHQPGLTPDQVADRLRATADPAPGGPASGGPVSQEYGAGIVNPYRAVTELPGGPARLLVPLATRPADAAALAAGRRSALLRRRSLQLASAVAAVTALVVLGAVVLPRGRRRRWRPGAAARASRTGPGERS